MVINLLLFALAATVTAAAEPPPRKAAPLPLRVEQPLTRVSSVAELADGRLLITDPMAPAVRVLNPTSGALTQLGSAGVDRDQYVQPGGLYAAADGTTRLVDRAQARVMVMTRDGKFSRTYSIEVKGTRTSTSADIDPWRIDGRGFSYFVDRTRTLGRPRGASVATVALVRFDPAAQRSEIVAELRRPESRSRTTPEGVQLSRDVIGSPADGWGVAPDGRIAIVRGKPYRVDWIAPGGAVTRGAEIEVDVIPMTDADREAFKKTFSGGASVGREGSGGGGGGLTGMEPEFAATKAPFSPADVIVSPDARVWVKRSRPAEVTTVVYDVFDERGRRIDRILFPEGSRVVGFGKGVVYVREDGPSGVMLKKYR